MSRHTAFERALSGAFSLDSDADSHPADELLIDYRAGRLQEVDMESMRSHLATCQECADFVLAADAFSANTSDLPEVEPEEVVTGWQELSRRLADESALPLRAVASSTPEPEPKPVTVVPATLAQTTATSPGQGISRWGWFGSPALGFGLAATLFFVIVGMHLARDRDLTRLAELEAWRATEGELTSDFSLHSIDAWGTTRGPGEVAEVRGGDVLVLFMTEDVDLEPLVLEVTDAEGHILHRVADPQGRADGLFKLKLPRDVLVPGRHDLVLRPAAGGAAVATYRIQVAASAP